MKNNRKNSENEKNRLLNKAIAIYEKADYRKALILFENLIKIKPELADGFKYYLNFCRNVIQSKPSPEDKLYESGRAIRGWVGLLWIPTTYLVLPIFKLFNSGLSFSLNDLVKITMGVLIFFLMSKIKSFFPFDTSYLKLKCKYCGHYTYYIEPNDGFAYMDSNNCSVCGRSYPMPSGMWDTFWGQSYMYERGSVTEPDFYKEFERDNPSYPKGEMANHYLKRDKKHKTRLQDK